VRAATADAPSPAPSIWRRPLLTLGALAAVALVTILTPWASGRDVPTPDHDETAQREATGVALNDDPSWDTMTELAASLSSDDVRVVLAVRPSVASVGDLTPKEREAFVRLLSRELGDLE
jgi:hypothetical protein